MPRRIGNFTALGLSNPLSSYYERLKTDGKNLSPLSKWTSMHNRKRDALKMEKTTKVGINQTQD